MYMCTTLLTFAAIFITIDSKPQCIVINPNPNNNCPSITILPNQFAPSFIPKEPIDPAKINNENKKLEPNSYLNEKQQQNFNNQENQWFQSPHNSNFYNLQQQQMQQGNPNFNQYHPVNNQFMHQQYPVPNFMPNQFMGNIQNGNNGMPIFNPQMPMGNNNYPFWMPTNNFPNPQIMNPNNTNNPNQQANPKVNITNEEVGNSQQMSVQNNIIVKKRNEKSNVNNADVNNIKVQPEAANKEVVKHNLSNINQDCLIFEEIGTKSTIGDICQVSLQDDDCKCSNQMNSNNLVSQMKNVPQIQSTFESILHEETLSNNNRPECNSGEFIYQTVPCCDKIKNSPNKIKPQDSSSISPTSPKATENPDSLIPVQICYSPYCTVDCDIPKCLIKKPKPAKKPTPIKPAAQKSKCKMYVDFVPVNFKC